MDKDQQVTVSLLEGIKIIRSSPVPMYYQIAEQLALKITNGELPPDTRLDNEIELSQQLGVSRITIRNAIAQLVKQNLVTRQRGLGTVVAPPHVRRPVALTSLYEDLLRAGKRPSTKVLKFEIVRAAPEVAAMLGIEQGQEVFHLERLRFADEEPIALMKNYLPSSLPITKEKLEQQGLYTILREAGIVINVATQKIGARAPSPYERSILGLAPREPVLTMSRVAYDSRGIAVEYGSHVYPASRYSFEMKLFSPEV